MKIFFATLLLALPVWAQSPTPSASASPVAAAPSAVGHWKTIDDKTGNPKSIVEIYQDGDQLKGVIRELINPSKPNPTCDECKGDKKGAPIVGLEIISGVKEVEAGQEWGHGEILDPQNGKTYSCKLKLKDKGEKLEVRGFIGFSLLGRSQIWERVTTTP